MKRKRHLNRVWHSRQGAMIIFILGLLTIMLAMVVFSVDTAYMQLARTELRAANDAAAKAAASALARSNGNDAQAIAEGIRIASLNTVAGAPLTLRQQDFEFGQAVLQADGRWTFMPGVTPYSSVRVTAEKSDATPSGPVNLLFAPVFGASTFTPQDVAVASQFDQEIVLAVDRSHSMAFDMTGTAWQYPYTTGNWIDHLLWRPHPSGSRWAALKSAMNVYLTTVERSARPPRVSLVTWGSYIGPGSLEYSLTGEIFPSVTTELLLTQSFPNINAIIKNRGDRTMHGGTNMGAGLDDARSILNGAGIRPLAKKIIILLTDGEWNVGRDPIECAQDAAAEGITIHTVGFLSNGTGVLQQIADITGGRALQASNQAELEAVFQDLAMTLPVALTE